MMNIREAIRRQTQARIDSARADSPGFHYEGEYDPLKKRGQCHSCGVCAVTKSSGFDGVEEAPINLELESGWGYRPSEELEYWPMVWDMRPFGFTMGGW